MVTSDFSERLQENDHLLGEFVEYLESLVRKKGANLQEI
ncbi:hypothetical protein SC09_Contig17orf00089 [Bacillus subtilis]|uniref:Uncharacterized protein n=1 Tax=Bacillus subtilis TaxID=1423 RepID=A0A0D1JKB5_BACIU|nr:hypothetical protein SC09_Contig17orf00089 [Bacillus subtilis]